MAETLAPKLKSAAVPDPEFDRLPIDDKRAWLQAYLAQGRTEIEAGQSVALESEADIDTLFQSIRAEAHEKAGLKP